MDFHVAFANSTEQRHLPGQAIIICHRPQHGLWWQPGLLTSSWSLVAATSWIPIWTSEAVKTTDKNNPSSAAQAADTITALWDKGHDRCLWGNIISDHSTDQGHHMTPGGNRGHGHQLRPSCSKTEDPDKVLSGSIDHRHQNVFKWQHMLLTSTQPLVVSWPMGINMASYSNTVLKHSHGQRK